MNLSPQQVRNLCRDGKLKAEKIGRSWILSEKAVKTYISNNNCGVAEDKLFYGLGRKKNNKPIVLSFFSGAMGMDIGLEKAGFDVLFASEINKSCRKTIVRNKPDVALVGDIRDYTPEKVLRIAGVEEDEEVDLIVGGPPCQAFSTAGKRKAFEDERGNVFLNFIDMIRGIRPKYAVIENVRGLLSAPLKHRPHAERGEGKALLSKEELPGGALNTIIKRLEKAGYTVNFNLYNAANYGTPQKRERVVIICSRDDTYIPFLEPTHAEEGAYGLEPWTSFRQAVKGLEEVEHKHLNFPEKRLKYYRLLKAGQNWRALPLELQKEALGKSFYAGGGKTGFLRRLAWDLPSPTLVTHPAMPATDLAHPLEDRPLSVQEYKRIQEFPDDWQIEGSIIEQYKQIGNAVPIGLGYAIGKHILRLMNKERIQEYEGFKFSRYKNTALEDWKEKFEQMAIA